MAAFLIDDTDDYPSPPSSTPTSLFEQYPDWSLLPSFIQHNLSSTPQCNLWDPHGLSSFRYGSSDHRKHLIKLTLQELVKKIDSSRDHSVAAHYLANYFAHSVTLYVRRKGDLNTRDFYVADELHQVHRLVSTMDAQQTICDSMHYIIDILDTELLKGGSPHSQRREIDRLKKEIKNTPKAEHLQDDLHQATQILTLRSMFTSNTSKQSIAREFMNKMNADCQRRGRYAVINQDTQWLPMANGFDLNLTTLKLRKRWLDYHIIGLSSAFFTVPAEDLHTSFSESTRRRLFGPIPNLLLQLAAGNTQRAQNITVSLYLQLLGHNKHKYLIFYMGQGHNGKSLLITLLREALGELSAPLHKSILFGGKETSSHSGFQIQLDSIRSGFMDDLGTRDVFNEQAVKMIVSPDVEMVMREAGHTRRGAAKARFRIGCSLVLACNYGAMPQIQMDRALFNRFRMIPFDATFVHAESVEGKPGHYKAEPGLLDKLKQPQHLSHFINYIVLAGRHYYDRNIRQQGEPLINERQMQEDLEKMLTPVVDQVRSLSSSSSSFSSPSRSSSSSFQTWWDTHVIYRPGEHVAIATLASAYMRDTKTSFRDPTKEFGQLLQTHYPHILRDKKKQIMTSVDGVRAKRMVLFDYQLYVAGIKEEDEDEDDNEVVIEDQDY